GRRQRAVRLLHGGLRLTGGRRHSEPGRRRPGRRPRRLPARVPPVGTYFPDREHSRRAAMDFNSGSGALLRARRARRLPAGGGLAGGVGGGPGDRRHRARVLRTGLARNACHAGEGMRRAWSRLFGGRFWTLAVKELRQIRRDRRLTISLIVPPTL